MLNDVKGIVETLELKQIVCYVCIGWSYANADSWFQSCHLFMIAVLCNCPQSSTPKTSILSMSCSLLSFFVPGAGCRPSLAVKRRHFDGLWYYVTIMGKSLSIHEIYLQYLVSMYLSMYLPIYLPIKSSLTWSYSNSGSRPVFSLQFQSFTDGKPSSLNLIYIWREWQSNEGKFGWGRSIPYTREA